MSGSAKAAGEFGWVGKRLRRKLMRLAKKVKVRAERRKAKRDPEAPATYNRFTGYED